MSTSTAPTPVLTRSRPRAAGRWMVSFVGFPLGGYASYLLIGPVDGLVPAVLGGALTGVILGSAQAWALRTARAAAVRWVVATAVGLMVGLGTGASLVGFATTLPALLVQGVVSGLAVGVAQAFVLGRAFWVWPPALGAAWAAGWAVTYAFGVRVEDQFTVFGSTGAVVVTALTLVLPLAIVAKENRS